MYPADLDLQRMLRRGAEWRVDRMFTEHDGAPWAIVVCDEQHRKVGAFAHPCFTSPKAAREWLLGFFLRALP